MQLGDKITPPVTTFVCNSVGSHKLFSLNNQIILCLAILSPNVLENKIIIMHALLWLYNHNQIKANSLLLPTVPVTLEVPPTVHEADLEFNATVILVRPEGVSAGLEINIMDTGITALNPG